MRYGYRAKHAVFLATIGICCYQATAVNTRTWIAPNTVSTKIFTDPANWFGGAIPGNDDIALIAQGSGGTILLGTGAGTNSSVGTLQLNRATDGIGTVGFFALNAGSTNTSVSTLTFAAATSGIVWDPASGGTYDNFFIGAARGTRGQLVSIVNNELAIRVRQGKGLFDYSTITGTGSITLDSLGSSGTSLGSLTLGYGKGPFESYMGAASSTFSGGVTVYKGRLNVADDSVGSPGSVTSGPAGTGPISFLSGGASIAANAQLSGDNFNTPSGARTIANTINFDADVDITGPWDMALTGTVNFENGSSRTLNVYPSGGHTATLGGTLNLGAGTAAFTLIKGGTGTLLLSDAAVNTTVGGGTIALDDGSGTIDLRAGTGVTRTSSFILAGDSAAPAGQMIKSGAGTIEVQKAYDVGTLNLIAGSLRFAQDGSASHVSRIGTLAFNGGSLDLYDNDLMLTATSYSTVATKIAAARNGGAWDGVGLTSTAARTYPSTPKITTLGTVTGGEYRNVYGTLTTFDGIGVASTDTLVKYTYYGDTDLNGAVNFDDYSRTDTGFSAGRSGWFNGDFDYNGVVNFDDYALIDAAFTNQGGVLTGGPDGNPRLIELGQMWHFRLDRYMEFYIDWNARLGIFYTAEDFYPNGNRPPGIDLPEPTCAFATILFALAPLRRCRRRSARTLGHDA